MISSKSHLVTERQGIPFTKLFWVCYRLHCQVRGGAKGTHNSVSEEFIQTTVPEPRRNIPGIKRQCKRGYNSSTVTSIPVKCEDEGEDEGDGEVEDESEVEGVASFTVLLLSSSLSDPSLSTAICSEEHSKHMWKTQIRFHM